MPVYAIYSYSADTCGNEEITGPDRFIQADNEEEVKEIFPEGFLVGFIVREIQVETLAWVKIQQQMLG
jgi:hypothetical protein